MFVSGGGGLGGCRPAPPRPPGAPLLYSEWNLYTIVMFCGPVNPNPKLLVTWACNKAQNEIVRKQQRAVSPMALYDIELQNAVRTTTKLLCGSVAAPRT
jgi:hypothetical protein